MSRPPIQPGWPVAKRFVPAQSPLDARLIVRLEDVAVTLHRGHRIQVAVDCECGTTVEACDDEELFDELLEHISSAHDAAIRQEPASLMTDAYDARP